MAKRKSVFLRGNSSEFGIYCIVSQRCDVISGIIAGREGDVQEGESFDNPTFRKRSMALLRLLREPRIDIS